MEREWEEVMKDILQLVEQKKIPELRVTLSEMNPADIAVIFDELDTELWPLIFRILPKELAAETFVYFDYDIQEALIGAFSDAELGDMMNHLYLDDTVDIIEEMPANVVKRILKQANSERRALINQILHYPKDSAGSIMTIEYIALRKNITVTQAFEKIRKDGMKKETIYTCYVVDSDRKLVGLLSIRDLLNAAPDALIGDIMETNMIAVGTHDDKEEVALAFGKYDLLALPVVDREERLVGIVTVDDALDVLQEEHTEDIEKMAAITPTDKPYLKTTPWEMWKKRIPWLMLLMISATFTGMIIGSFEEKLAASVVLTSFIPMLMDTGGNSGGQASVMVVRGLSLGEIEMRDLAKVLWKEIRVAFFCGITLGVICFVKLMLLDRWILGNAEVTIPVALVVCSTLVATVLLAKAIGCSLPILAKRVGFDPAVMASPFITTIVDALSLLIYFWLATTILNI